jgi:hypothetical protein
MAQFRIVDQNRRPIENVFVESSLWLFAWGAARETDRPVE